MADGGARLLSFRAYEIAMMDLLDMLVQLQNRGRTVNRGGSAISVVHPHTIAKDLLQKHLDRSNTARKRREVYE